MSDWQEGWKAPKDGSWIISVGYPYENTRPLIVRYVEREYTGWKPVTIEGDPRELQEVIRECKHGFWSSDGHVEVKVKWWKPLGPLPE